MIQGYQLSADTVRRTKRATLGFERITDLTGRPQDRLNPGQQCILAKLTSRGTGDNNYKYAFTQARRGVSACEVVTGAITGTLTENPAIDIAEPVGEDMTNKFVVLARSVMVEEGEEEEEVVKGAWIIMASVPAGLLFGKLVDDWEPGTNQVTLTPCLAANNGTPIEDAEDVTCYIQFPISRPAVSFGGEVDDILAYEDIGGGLYKLYDPPLLPRATAEHQVLINAGTAGGANWIADWVRGHG